MGRTRKVVDGIRVELGAGQKRPPVSRRSTVVSVRLASSDFQRIAERAEAAGVYVSEFIRDAAIAAIQPVVSEAIIYPSPGLGMTFFESKAAPWTDARNAIKTEETQLEPSFLT